MRLRTSLMIIDYFISMLLVVIFKCVLIILIEMDFDLIQVLKDFFVLNRFFTMAGALSPFVYWAQTEDHVTLRVALLNAKV